MHRMYSALRHISICLDAGGCFFKVTVLKISTQVVSKHLLDGIA